jgi:hypothetical protein
VRVFQDRGEFGQVEPAAALIVDNTITTSTGFIHDQTDGTGWVDDEICLSITVHVALDPGAGRRLQVMHFAPTSLVALRSTRRKAWTPDFFFVRIRSADVAFVI